MFEELEKVKIKSLNIVGTIVDKTNRDGKTRYIVESDEKYPAEKGYGNSWPLFDCYDDDLIRI